MVSNEQRYEFQLDQVADHLPHQRAFRKIGLQLFSLYSVSSQSVVVEIGPGTGDVAILLKKLGFTVVLVEPSLDAIELLRKRLPDIPLIERSGYDPIPRSEQQHTFLALEVIEHCFDPESLLRNIFNHMRNGEIFIVSTPYHGYLKNLLIALLGRYDQHHNVDWVAGHIKFFSIQTFTRMAERVGFEVLTTKPYGRIPLLWRGMFFALQKNV